MSAKSKSATPNTKTSPATPRVSRGVAKPSSDSISSLHNGRVSVDRSPGSIASKPKVDRPSPKLTTPTSTDKKATRIVKPFQELQAELNQAQEDLKKANEKLVSVEKEKASALDELKEAKRLCDEANEKLRAATVAQKRAEENSEIEKFRAVEVEQAGIEAANKKEDEWQREVEAVRNQHAVDVAALLSATQEIQKLKQELAMMNAAKNQALNHADDATKIAEIHAEKVEVLSAELIRLKGELDSRVEMEAIENDKLVSELKMERDSMREELEQAKTFEEKLVEKEAILEQINVDLEASRMAEYYAHNLVGELRARVEELMSEAEQANILEKSASESLKSVTKQLEENNGLLDDAKSEIAILREKVVLLEISIGKQKGDLEESEHLLERAKEEASELVKKVEFLDSELETVREEKLCALNNEKLKEDIIQTLLVEKNKLVNELETSRDEEEKSKKALESLTSALHEVSSDAREVKEKLISIQAEHENYEVEIEDLKRNSKSTNEKYESLLADAKKEIDSLSNSVKQSKQDYNNLKAELEEKELNLTNSVKKSEEEKSRLENEINRLINSLKLAEEEACSSREEGNRWKKSFKEADLEVVSLKGDLDEAKAESVKLKENLSETEIELQKILSENEGLRKREAASLEKVDELSKSLEEALAKKQEEEENDDLTDCEKDYDVLPKVVEFSEQNGTGEVKPNVGPQSQEIEQPVKEKLTSGSKNSNGKSKDGEEKGIDNAADHKMWESCKIDVKELSIEGETEQELYEDELERKADLYDQANGELATENVGNGGTSPSKSNGQKKKKALLQKFGSLLKKKGSNSQK